MASSPNKTIPEDPNDALDSPTSPSHMASKKISQTRLQLIPWSSVPMTKPVLNELVERRVKEGDSFQVGRQVHKDVVPGQPASPDREYNALDVWFVSKVVSRAHAEFQYKDGQLFVKDIGSSSGTFLNKSRLSPSAKESKLFPLKEGDILQFGVDYKGKPDDIYKSITVRIGFYDQSWVHAQKKKVNPSKFRVALKTLLASTAPNAESKMQEGQQDEETANECCVCIGETGAFQALFLAPCSHCFHYKCVSHIIVQSALFQCPLCRQVANLTASVSCDSLPDLGDVAIGALGDKKYFDTKPAHGPNDDHHHAQAAPSAHAAAPEAENRAAPIEKTKKRRSSFTSKLGLFLGRRLSVKENRDQDVPLTPGGSNPSNANASTHANTPSSARVPLPSNQAGLLSPVSAVASPIANPQLHFAEDVNPEDGGNDPNYAFSSSSKSGGIPRSATMNTMDERAEEGESGARSNDNLARASTSAR